VRGKEGEGKWREAGKGTGKVVVRRVMVREGKDGKEKASEGSKRERRWNCVKEVPGLSSGGPSEEEVSEIL